MYTSGRLRAFTLIELLIVISVIAVLIAMISPMLRHAREVARLTRCANNLRQIHFAMVDYAEDYRDRLPDAVTLNSGRTHPRHLHTLLADHQSGDQDIFQCPSDQGYYAWFLSNVYTVWFGCSYQNRGEDKNFNHWLAQGRVSGKYHAFGGQAADYYPAPSRLGIVRDGCGWHYLGYHGGRGGSSRAQYLFLDGHVEWFSRERPIHYWARIW